MATTASGGHHGSTRPSRSRLASRSSAIDSTTRSGVGERVRADGGRRDRVAVPAQADGARPGPLGALGRAAGQHGPVARRGERDGDLRGHGARPEDDGAPLRHGGAAWQAGQIPGIAISRSAVRA